jgi:hypothetical protein
MDFVLGDKMSPRAGEVFVSQDRFAQQRPHALYSKADCPTRVARRRTVTRLSPFASGGRHRSLAG